MYTKYLLNEVQILVRFALRFAVSEIQHVLVHGPQKSEIHRMTPNWISTLNSQ